jgi:5-hydroxyisourate hydrolase
MNTHPLLRSALAPLLLLCLTLVFWTPAARAQAPAGGRLTAHVLDLYTGAPANGMRIDLLKVDGNSTTVLKSVTTNVDGRPPEGPLLVADTIKTGRYQAVVYIGDYYKRIGAKVPAGFHNRLILEFDILDTKLPHHLPFQITPFTQTASVLPG